MEKVVGLKDSSGDFVTFSRVVRRRGKRGFAWIQGEDSLDAESLILGVSGVVTGLGNVWIEPYVEMYRVAEEGDFSRGPRVPEEDQSTLQGTPCGREQEHSRDKSGHLPSWTMRKVVEASSVATER